MWIQFLCGSCDAFSFKSQGQLCYLITCTGGRDLPNHARIIYMIQKFIHPTDIFFLQKLTLQIMTSLRKSRKLLLHKKINVICSSRGSCGLDSAGKILHHCIIQPNVHLLLWVSCFCPHNWVPQCPGNVNIIDWTNFIRQPTLHDLSWFWNIFI